MLGPPASGKGTQAVHLAQSRGIPKISTGDILREAGQAGTALGLKAKALMDRGELVSDEDMVNIVRERLSRPDAAHGFILDGFPRTVSQAQTLDTMMDGQPLVIIDLAVPDGELIHRMEERRVCSKCAAERRAGIDLGGDVRALRRQDGDARRRRGRERPAAPPGSVQAREQAAAGLLPLEADVPIDQRRAGAREGGRGAGGGDRRDDAGQRARVGDARAAAVIVCRSAAELRRLRTANQLVGQVLQQLREAVAPGVTTADLDALAEREIRAAGAVPAFKGY